MKFTLKLKLFVKYALDSERTAIIVMITQVVRLPPSIISKGVRMRRSTVQTGAYPGRAKRAKFQPLSPHTNSNHPKGCQINSTTTFPSLSPAFGTANKPAITDSRNKSVRHDPRRIYRVARANNPFDYLLLHFRRVWR